MFASSPVDLMPKRYGSTMRSLPPIETLQPETLKDFTKEDLRCYLEAAGLTPGITKPEMKRQMRSLINQITGSDDKFTNQFPVSLQPSFVPPVQYIPTPLTSPPSLNSGGSLPNFAEGDIQCTDCPKKGNKECHYKRCRTCCLRKMKDLGYRCGPHLRDSDRRGGPQRMPSFVSSQTPGTPVPIPTYPSPQAPITRSSTMPPPPPRYPSAPSLPSLPLPPTPSTVVSPIQPVPTTAVSAPLPIPLPHPPPSVGPVPVPPAFSSFSSFPQASPAVPPSNIPSIIPQQSSFVLSVPILQPPSPMEPGEVSPYSVAECPRCHKVVSTLGANLWLHLKDCDPDHIMDYVRLLHEGRLCTPTLSEKEKSDPIRIAHQNATLRNQQTITYLKELFSSTSVDELVEWHAKLPPREEEQKRAVDTFTTAMEKMTDILTRSSEEEEVFLSTFQARAKSFYQHLDLLDTCTTLDEVSARASEFTKELNMSVEAEPTIVRISMDVAQRKNAEADAEIRRDDAKGKKDGGEKENGKHVAAVYDKEMVDVSEAPPLSLVAL